MTSTRLEINIKRLMKHCEEMAKNDFIKNWRLEKYLESLDQMIKQLQNESSGPPKGELQEYIRQVQVLKGLIATSKLSNPVERVVATQLLPSVTFSSSESKGSNITTQIHQKTAAKYNQELRVELFKTKSETSDTNLRQRIFDSTSKDNDLDDLLKYNRNMQEKVAENMLSMTSTMKEHALTANAIIRKDLNSLEKSNQLTEYNETKLKSESLKLEEHTKSTWRCWVWLMVIFVITVFFNMIFFIKVAKKKV